MFTKPIQVKEVKPHVIWVLYEDNTEGQVDLADLVGKPVFRSWDEPGYFDKVYIDTETNAIAWDEIIELCPNSLHLQILNM